MKKSILILFVLSFVMTMACKNDKKDAQKTARQQLKKKLQILNQQKLQLQKLQIKLSYYSIQKAAPLLKVMWYLDKDLTTCL